jgi:hypothetical protein
MYLIPVGHEGKTAVCAACKQRFVLQRSVSPATAAVAAPRRESRPVAGPGATTAAGLKTTAGGEVCVVCQSRIAHGEPRTDCGGCATRYHQECWDYNGGCGVYGCSQAAKSEGLSGIEIPASHWGREEKDCPNCGNTIQAAALRCRFCGATFSSADPQSRSRFFTDRRDTAKAGNLTKTCIWLFIFSLIPCTAPVAAVCGLVWYQKNYRAIRRLPSITGALCKIALGVAVVQSVLMIVMSLLFQVFAAG